jgi:hypothetical protein
MDNFERIAANAELVIRTFPNADLGYDRESVEWIDGYIERNRLTWDSATKESLGSVLGSFLGECFRRNFDADWEMDDHGLAIVFPDGNKAFPFNRVNKQIAEGAEESIFSFYETAELLFTK